jgi:hypothetical protein
MPNLAALQTTIIGVVAVVGATVAVCLGHISEATYFAVVGPLAGAGVGAGLVTHGVNTGATLTPLRNESTAGGSAVGGT